MTPHLKGQIEALRESLKVTPEWRDLALEVIAKLEAEIARAKGNFNRKRCAAPIPRKWYHNEEGPPRCSFWAELGSEFCYKHQGRGATC